MITLALPLVSRSFPAQPVIGTLYPSLFVQSWPTFVLPFVVIFVLSVFLLTFYFIYRRRRRYYHHAV